MMNTQLPVRAHTAKSPKESEIPPARRLEGTPNVHVEAGKNIKNATVPRAIRKIGPCLKTVTTYSYAHGSGVFRNIALKTLQN